MPALILPPKTLLNHLFSYDPKVGDLIWKNPRTNRTKAGDRAGNLHTHGYIHVRINGKLYKAHRLVWKMVHGSDPVDQLDHINRIRSDNRISNLREASNVENSRNHSLSRSNTTGITGINFLKGARFHKSPWRAFISNDTDKRISKTFNSLLDAVCWRKAREKQYNYTSE